MSTVKPEYTSSICQVKSNFDVPATLLEKLLSENKSAVGMVVKEADRMFVEKEIRLSNDPAVVKTWITNVMGHTKKFPAMFSFHAIQSGEYDEDEVQPWTVVKDSKGKPMLCVCIEGDFPQHVDTSGEGLSESFILMRDWLHPKLTHMYGLCGNNITKLVEYIKSAQFAADFKAVVGHRGVLAFMPFSGDQFMVQKNDIGASEDWGEVSNAYGYTPSVVAAATPATATATSGSRYSAPLPDAPAAPAPAPQPPPIPQQPPAGPIEKVAAAATQDVEVEEEVDWTPDAKLHGKDLKLAYRKVNAHLPENEQLPKNWKERPTIKIKTKKTVKSLADLGQTAVGATAIAQGTPNVTVLSGEQMAKATAFLKKHLGDGSAAIADPVNSNKDEEAVAKFSELFLGKNLEQVRRLSTETLANFRKENPEAIDLLVLELRAVARKYWDLIRDPAAMTAIINAAKAAPAQVVAQPAAVASAGAGPAPAPAKRNRGAAEFA